MLHSSLTRANSFSSDIDRLRSKHRSQSSMASRPHAARIGECADFVITRLSGPNPLPLSAKRYIRLRKTGLGAGPNDTLCIARSRPPSCVQKAAHWRPSSSCVLSVNHSATASSPPSRLSAPLHDSGDGRNISINRSDPKRRYRRQLCSSRRGLSVSLMGAALLRGRCLSMWISAVMTMALWTDWKPAWSAACHARGSHLSGRDADPDRKAGRLRRSDQRRSCVRHAGSKARSSRESRSTRQWRAARVISHATASGAALSQVGNLTAVVLRLG